MQQPRPTLKRVRMQAAQFRGHWILRVSVITAREKALGVSGSRGLWFLPLADLVADECVADFCQQIVV